MAIPLVKIVVPSLGSVVIGGVCELTIVELDELVCAAEELVCVEDELVCAEELVCVEDELVSADEIAGLNASLDVAATVELPSSASDEVSSLELIGIGFGCGLEELDERLVFIIL